jgi:hypothetical protein
MAAHSWESIAHIFVEEGDKESLKTTFGFKAVPFYAVFDQVMIYIIISFLKKLYIEIIIAYIYYKAGRIVQCGDGKAFNVFDVLRSVQSSAVTTTTTPIQPSISIQEENHTPNSVFQGSAMQPTADKPLLAVSSSTVDDNNVTTAAASVETAAGQQGFVFELSEDF